MVRFRVILIIAFSLIFFAGCSAFFDGTPGNPVEQGRGLRIVASFYPLGEIAEKVGGDAVKVKVLTPPGAEPHDYEPTPQEIVDLYKSNLLIYMGNGFEPWVELTVPRLQESGVKILKLSASFHDLLPSTKQENEELAYDPHVWLDPVLFMEQVDLVKKQFQDQDPANMDAYQRNAQDYKEQLAALNRLFENGLKKCQQRSFVTNHAAFAYLSRRYGLQMIPITGISPEEEPSPKRLIDLAKLLKEKGIKYILVEPFLSPKFAETLAREVGAEILVLNPLESLSRDEIKKGKNYVSVMKENLQNLQIALKCERIK